MIRSALLLLLFLPTLQLTATDSLTVEAIHERLLMVKYVEGTIEFHQNGSAQGDDAVTIVPLDVAEATSPGNYTLSSGDDAAYSTGMNPDGIARKTKTNRISSRCDGWGDLEYYGVMGCQGLLPDRVLEHYLYLELPAPLTSGSTYTLELSESINDTPQAVTFIWDDRSSHSDALHVNNLGYVPAAPLKAGYLYHWAGDRGGLDFAPYAGLPFHLIDTQDESIAYTGQVAFRKPADNVETLQENPEETPNQNFQAAAVWECDFSDFTATGSYRLSVPGVGASFPFAVGEDVYREPFVAVMRSFYHNRSGIAKTEPYTSFTRPAAHNPTSTPGFEDRLFYTDFTICEATSTNAAEADKANWEAGRRGNLEETFGWYQDAGDWDGYPTHTKVPSTLMFLLELFPDNFTDGELNIPESGNEITDVLDEARWLPRFFKRLKDETEAKGWSSGGVGGARVFPDLWGGDLGPDNIGRGSWQDTDRDWYVSGEEPVNTFAYAGMAAHLAFLLQREEQADPEGIDWLAEAEATFAWADERYRTDYPCQNQSITRKKNYAAAALYRMTGEENYHTAFKESWAEMVADNPTTNDGPYGGFIYLTLPATQTDADLRTEVRTLIEGYADFTLLEFTEERAMRVGGNPYFPMLVGQATSPMIVEGIMTYALLRDEDPEKAERYRKYLYTTADYFLGTNPLNFTWITGLGDRHPEELFHLDFWYDDIPGYPAGFIPYGPWRRDTNWNVMGPWDRHFPETSLHPPIAEWPGHERWFGQRPSPLTAEFTVHQTLIDAAALYGALAATATTDGGSTSTRGGRQLSGVSIYPNPTSAITRLSGIAVERVSSLSLQDISGKSVLQLPVRLEIDLSAYPPGVYILKVVSRDGRQASLRIVKP